MGSKKNFPSTRIWKNRVSILIGAVLVVSLFASFLAQYFMTDIKAHFGDSLGPVLTFLSALLLIFIFIVLPILEKKLQAKAEKTQDKPWPQVYQIFLFYIVLFLLPLFFGPEVVDYLEEQGLPPYLLPFLLLGLALLVGLFRGFSAMVKK